VRSGAASTPGSGQGSGGFWCRYLVRFRKVPVQIPREVPGVPVKIPCEVPEVSGAGRGSGGLRWRYCTWLGSRVFWCRYRKFRSRYLLRFRKVPVQRPCEVPEGFDGEDAW